MRRLPALNVTTSKPLLGYLACNAVSKAATIMTTQSIAPSIAFPETPERRAEIARQIRAATELDELLLERVVRAFYGTARQDPVIGHLFDDVQDWEAHIARITAFSSSVALISGRYHGNPMGPHLKLPLEPPHFAHWLTLFEQTVRDLCLNPAVICCWRRRAALRKACNSASRPNAACCRCGSGPHERRCVAACGARRVRSRQR